MSDLPARFAALIITFAPLYVHRSWQHARVLLVGAILAPGRRTVASILRMTGYARDQRSTNYHRVCQATSETHQGNRLKKELTAGVGLWASRPRRR